MRKSVRVIYRYRSELLDRVPLSGGDDDGGDNDGGGDDDDDYDNGIIFANIHVFSDIYCKCFSCCKMRFLFSSRRILLFQCIFLRLFHFVIRKNVGRWYFLTGSVFFTTLPELRK